MRRSSTVSLVARAGLAAIAVSACGGDEMPEYDSEASGDASEVMVVETDPLLTLDANGDSYLDVDEIAEWVDDEGIFTRWDIDRDSEIDEDEIEGNPSPSGRLEWDSGLAFHGIPIS